MLSYSKDIEIIKKSINSYEKENELLKGERKTLTKIYDSTKSEYVLNKISKLKQQENLSLSKISNLKTKLNILYKHIFEKSPNLKSKEMIYLKEFETYKYDIYLPESDINVGNIDYYGYHDSRFYGDLEYEIYKEFRGNHYAYHALCLLSEILYDKDIPDFWISAYKSNLASIKTIEKYGGTKIPATNYKVALYECETRKLHNERRK